MMFFPLLKDLYQRGGKTPNQCFWTLAKNFARMEANNNSGKNAKDNVDDLLANGDTNLTGVK